MQINATCLFRGSCRKLRGCLFDTDEIRFLAEASFKMYGFYLFDVLLEKIRSRAESFFSGHTCSLFCLRLLLVKFHVSISTEDGEMALPCNISCYRMVSLPIGIAFQDSLRFDSARYSETEY